MILFLSLLEIINQIEFYTVSINSFLITIARGLYHRFEIVYVSIVEDEKEIGIGSKWTILDEAERVMIRENPLSLTFTSLNKPLLWNFHRQIYILSLATR